MKTMISDKCGIIGAGRLGSAIAQAMTQAGYNFIWVGSKNNDEAGELAEKIGCKNFGTSFASISVKPELIIITVPDSSIAAISSQAVSSGIIGDKTIVLHTSGVHNSDILKDCREAGASVAAFHPCQTVTFSSNPQEVFRNIIFDMEGDNAACQAGEQIAQKLGAEAIRLDPEARLLTHTAMTILSNYTVSLYEAAENLLESSGIGQENSRKMLNPLLSATVGNIIKLGPHKALTGPVSRGDSETVEKHLKVLNKFDKIYGEIYSDLGRMTLSMISDKIPREDYEKLEKYLNSFQENRG